MARAQATTVINQPASVVFAYLIDWDKGTRWQRQLVEVAQTSGGSVGLGTTIKEVRSLMGRRIETTFKVPEFEHNKKVTFESIQAPFPMQAHYNLEPVPGGTQVAFIVEAELTGIYKMAETMVAHSAKIQRESDFALLKQILEADS